MNAAYLVMPEPANLDAMTALPGEPVMLPSGAYRNELGRTRAALRRTGAALLRSVARVGGRLADRIEPQSSPRPATRIA